MNPQKKTHIRLHWDGDLPERRYAIFNSLIYGDYMIVIRGEDIKTAEKWGGFVRWVGGIKPAERRIV